MGNADRKSKRLSSLWPIALLVALLVLVWLLRGRLHLDPAVLKTELANASWLQLLFGVIVIWTSTVLRAFRWSALLPPEQNATSRGLRLIAPQYIGFAAVALFGRVVDLARPYLIARRLNSPIATQMAVYSLERAFDLGAAALLFSITLLFIPHNTPNRETFLRAGLVSIAATLFLVAVTLAARFAGEWLARTVRLLLGRVSPKLGAAVADKLLEFRLGLATIGSLRQLLVSLVLSLAIWLLIAYAYIFAAHSLTTTPQLANMTLPAVMLLLATSMGASLFQLPVLGWFTQTAALAAAYTALYGVPVNAATTCALLTVFVNTLCVIPPGIVAARLGGTSLGAIRKAEAAA